MEPPAGKPSFLKNILGRLLIFGVFVIIVRFAYVVTIAGESCNVGDFCFFSLPDNFNLVISGGSTGFSAISVRNDVAVPSPVKSVQTDVKSNLYSDKEWIGAVQYYSSVFQDLVADGVVSPASKSLCLETPKGEEVFALREIGVSDAIGIYRKGSKPLVISGDLRSLPFGDNTIDFVFSGGARFEKIPKPLAVASEIQRTLKPEGFAVVHVTAAAAKDEYSFNSFIELFNSCKIVRTRDLEGFDPSVPLIKEIVLQKLGDTNEIIRLPKLDENSGKECSVPGYKREIVRNAEPLIEEEPLKPWITLKKNLKNIKYLSSMVDVSFKNRYVYVDVGARSYGSSIGSWFKKQYPKQNKTFEVYAIEADKAFHEEYKLKKKVNLLPYAAWVRNESLTFEINHDPGKEVKARGRGMGRIQPVKGKAANFDGELHSIQGFDFADWLKNTVEERDLVVMKMDVEGTEFDLIPRLFETGAICLIDEIFLECHYNRWQRCCPGERSSKYEKTYGQCLELFQSLRERGVLVHQWW